MVLSNDLISQFVKATKDKDTSKKEATVYGTAVEYNGDIYVRVDGSDHLTPVSKTANVNIGERVTVMIKNHTATVTGNLSSPSARTEDVEIIGDQVTVFDTILADVVRTDALNAQVARIDELVAGSVDILGRLTATEADISWLEVNKLDAETAELTYATIVDLDAVTIEVDELKANYGEFTVVTTERLDAVEALINDLDVDGTLTVESLEGKFANVSFSNIGVAAIKTLYTTSGIIKDATISDGVITGTLSGVTITGDLIKANTILADKLVIKGTDGLYYRLNTDGVTTEAEQTSENSLNGSVILAKSIAASKISVTDLVAFGATIGGFHIGDDSIFSGAKSTVANTTRGIYLDTDGQVSFGDANNFITYYKDTDGTYKLEVSAESFTFTTTSKTIADTIADVQKNIDGIAIGGTNILRSTNTVSSLDASSSWANGTWRSAGGGTGTRTVIDITDAPNADIKVGFEIVGNDTDTTTAQDSVPVVEGLEYTLSCYARGTGILRLQVGKSPYSSNTHEFNEVTEWVKCAYTFVAGEGNGLTDGKTNVYIGNRGTGSLQVCGFKMELGNVATDWTPSPNDVKIKAEAASRTATDYMNLSSAGLVVGQNPASPSAGNTLISTDGVSIRKGTTVLAEFKAASRTASGVSSATLTSTDSTDSESDGVTKVSGTIGKNETRANIYITTNGNPVYFPKGLETSKVLINDDSGIISNANILLNGSLVDLSGEGILTPLNSYGNMIIGYGRYQDGGGTHVYGTRVKAKTLDGFSASVNGSAALDTNNAQGNATFGWHLYETATGETNIYGNITSLFSKDDIRLNANENSIRINGSIIPYEAAKFNIGAPSLSMYNMYISIANDGFNHGIKFVNASENSYNAVGVNSTGWPVFGNTTYCTNLISKSTTTSDTGYSFKITCGDNPDLTLSDNDARLFLFGGTDSTSRYIGSCAAYKRTYSASPNMVITDNSIIGRSTSSSERYKHDISVADIDELSGLYNLPVKKFKYNDDYIATDDELYDNYLYGFIVEDLEDILPCAVQHITDENGKKVPEMWNSNIIIPALLKLIQDLNSRLKTLEQGV